jgi:Tfp pilus assembly protein PilE
MSERITRLHAASARTRFTVIELLVVIVAIGILLAIGVPSYIGFRDRANDNAAKANLQAALPAVEAYYADEGTYGGMTAASLAATTGESLELTAVSATDATYCIQSTVGGRAWKIAGPDDTRPVSGTC